MGSVWRSTKEDDIIITAKVNDINIDMRLVPVCEEENWALGNSIFMKQPNHKLFGVYPARLASCIHCIIRAFKEILTTRK